MVFLNYIQILIEHSVGKQRRPRSTLPSATFDLGLRCFPTSHKTDARLIWVCIVVTAMYIKQEIGSEMRRVINI